MYSPQSWAQTGFDDGTEVKNVDLATRENSNASQLIVEGNKRERGKRGGEAWCQPFPPPPGVALDGNLEIELMFEEGTASITPLT